MNFDKLAGKKLIRISELFCWRSSSHLFEFEDGLSLYIREGQETMFQTYEEMLQFLDGKKLSDAFYQDHYYRKRTALEEYSIGIFGKVQSVYEKYPKVVSVDCRECVWRKYPKSKKQCQECWALQWNSSDPEILKIIERVV